MKYFIFVCLILTFIYYTDGNILHTNSTSLTTLVGGNITMHVFKNVTDVNEIKFLYVEFGSIRIATGAQQNFRKSELPGTEDITSRVTSATYDSTQQLYTLVFTNLTLSNDGLYKWTIVYGSSFTRYEIDIRVHIKGGPYQCSASLPSTISVETGSTASVVTSMCGNPAPNVTFDVAGEKLSVTPQLGTQGTFNYTYPVNLSNIVITPSMCGQNISYVAQGETTTITEVATLEVEFDPPSVTIENAYLNGTCTMLYWKKINIGRCSGLIYEINYMNTQSEMIGSFNVTMETNKHSFCTNETTAYTITKAQMRAHYKGKMSQWMTTDVNFTTLPGGPYICGNPLPQQLQLSTNTNSMRNFTITLCGNPQPDLTFTIGGSPNNLATTNTSVNGQHVFNVTFPEVTPAMCNKTLTYLASKNGKLVKESSTLSVDFDSPSVTIENAYLNGTCTTLYWKKIDIGRCSGLIYEINYMNTQSETIGSFNVTMETNKHSFCNNETTAYTITTAQMRAHYKGKMSQWTPIDVNFTALPGGPIQCGAPLPNQINLSADSNLMYNFTVILCGHPEPDLSFTIGQTPSSSISRMIGQLTSPSFKVNKTFREGRHIFHVTFPDIKPSMCNQTMTYVARKNGIVVTDSTILSVDFSAPNVVMKIAYLNLNCVKVEWENINTGSCSGLEYQVEYLENDVPTANATISTIKHEYCTNQQSVYNISKVRLRSVYKGVHGNWTPIQNVNYTAGVGPPFQCGDQLQSTLSLVAGNPNNNFKLTLCGNPKPALNFDIDGTPITLSSSAVDAGKQKYIYTVVFSDVTESMCGKALTYTAAGHGTPISASSVLDIQFDPPSVTVISAIRKPGCFVSTWQKLDIGNCTGLNYNVNYLAYNITEYSVNVGMEVGNHEFCPRNIDSYNITRVAVRSLYNSKQGSFSYRSFVEEEAFEDHWPYIYGGIIGGALFLLLLLLILICFLCCRSRKKERTGVTDGRIGGRKQKKQVYHVFNEEMKPAIHNVGVQVDSQQDEVTHVTRVNSLPDNRYAVSNNVKHIVTTFPTYNVNGTFSRQIEKPTMFYTNQTFNGDDESDEEHFRTWNVNGTFSRQIEKPTMFYTNQTFNGDDESDEEHFRTYSYQIPIPVDSVTGRADVIKSVPERYENTNTISKKEKQDIIYKIHYPEDSLKQHLV